MSETNEILIGRFVSYGQHWFLIMFQLVACHWFQFSVATKMKSWLPTVNSIESHTTLSFNTSDLTHFILASNWARRTSYFWKERETINSHDELNCVNRRTIFILLIVQLMQFPAWLLNQQKIKLELLWSRFFNVFFLFSLYKLKILSHIRNEPTTNCKLFFA